MIGLIRFVSVNLFCFQEILCYEAGCNKFDFSYHGNASLQTSLIPVKLVLSLNFTPGLDSLFSKPINLK